MRPLIPLFFLSALTTLPAYADEGMWPLNAVPKDRLQTRYGFAPDDAWLAHVRSGAARIASGCSGSFVSSAGLLLTNHHCAHRCIQQLSSAQRDYIATGFSAATAADEQRCPDFQVEQLVDIRDVTPRLAAATAGAADQRQHHAAEKAEVARIEKECAGKDSGTVRCEVVPLYHGGAFHLYRYRRYTDVRLVFAPEYSVSFFGGNPDDFTFPRYALDFTFLRAYDNGRPAQLSAEQYFRWSPAGPAAGELTFIAGHPGSTARELTIAQLTYLRDVTLPERLILIAELRGQLTEFQRRSPEARRVSGDLMFGLDGGYKGTVARFETLTDPGFFAAKIAEEKALRDKVARDPALAGKYGGAWDAIARAQLARRRLHKLYGYAESSFIVPSRLVGLGRTLVRAADERLRPDGERLSEYRDANLASLELELGSPIPLDDDLESLLIASALTRMRADLGLDHPFVRKVLGGEAPEEVAARLIKGTRLKDPAVRRALWQGGRAAVLASADPLLRFVRLADADARAVRKQYEDEVEAVVRQSSELLAKARFAVLGTSTYPDATFTLRLSFGPVAGWEDGGRAIAPFTTLGGLYERATGRAPYALPERWLKARSRLNLSLPFNFAGAHDIINGNSGSPVLNRKAEIVGVMFDGNMQMIGADYGFDGASNRSVSVHSGAILEALIKVYGATRVVDELRPAPR